MAVDGRPVADERDLAAALQGRQAGETVRLQVVRLGEAEGGDPARAPKLEIALKLKAAEKRAAVLEAANAELALNKLVSSIATDDILRELEEAGVELPDEAKLDKLSALFNKYDKDKSGTIDAYEYAAALLLGAGRPPLPVVVVVGVVVGGSISRWWWQ